MRKKLQASKLMAAAVALTMTMPIGTLASNAMAQATQSGAAQEPSSQVPQPQEGGVNWPGVGYGVGSVATDVVYIPAKVVYAILGGLVGGGAYVLTGGNTQTSDTIWRSSLGGDYVVTPDMLAGKQPIHFTGPTETPPQTTSGVQPIAPPSPSPSASSANSAPGAGSPGALSATGSGSAASQPMDRGAGPVNGGRNSNLPSSLPNTSIE